MRRWHPRPLASVLCHLPSVAVCAFLLLLVAAYWAGLRPVVSDGPRRLWVLSPEQQHGLARNGLTRHRSGLATSQSAELQKAAVLPTLTAPGPREADGALGAAAGPGLGAATATHDANEGAVAAAATAAEAGPSVGGVRLPAEADAPASAAGAAVMTAGARPSTSQPHDAPPLAPAPAVESSGSRSPPPFSAAAPSDPRQEHAAAAANSPTPTPPPGNAASSGDLAANTVVAAPAALAIAPPAPLLALNAVASPAVEHKPGTAPAIVAAPLALTPSTNQQSSLSLRYVIPTVQLALAELDQLNREQRQQHQQWLQELRRQHGGLTPLHSLVARTAAAGWGRAGPAPPPPPNPVPKPSRGCPAEEAAADQAAGAPGYHMVVLASPRAQHGRYLASTLISVSASDARPTTLTVLWGAHRRRPPATATNQTVAASAAAAAAGPAAAASGGTGSRKRGLASVSQAGAGLDQEAGAVYTGGSDSSNSGRTEASSPDHQELHVSLVQRVEMPPPPPPPPSASVGTDSGESDNDGAYDSTFSLLANLQMYERSWHRSERRATKGAPDGGGPAAGAGAGGQPGRTRGSFPPLRVRYLPDTTPEGEVMRSYYLALKVPEQVAKEAGDPSLKRLPLLVLEADVLLAPRFGDRMGCLMRMMQDLARAPAAANANATASNASSAGGSSSSSDHGDHGDHDVSSSNDGGPFVTPDFAISLYDPSTLPKDVGEVLRGYDKSTAPRDQVRPPRGGGGRSGGATRVGGASGSGTQGGSDGGTGAQIRGGGEGGGAAFTQLSLVPTLWSWGSQGLLYSYGIRVSLLRHYRELAAGCRPHDGLQDIELVRHMEVRGCLGLPWIPPVTGKATVTGPACDPRVLHAGEEEYEYEEDAAAAASRSAGSGTSGGACYLFTVRPNMVQHVGASSALFGSVSKRYHMTFTFPERVAIPGMDEGDTW